MTTSLLFAFFIFAATMTSSLADEGSGGKENLQEITYEEYLTPSIRKIVYDRVASNIHKRKYERVASNSNMLKAEGHLKQQRTTNQVSPIQKILPQTPQFSCGESLETENTQIKQLQYTPRPMPGEHLEKEKTVEIKRMKLPETLQTKRDVSLERFRREKMAGTVSMESPDILPHGEVFGEINTIITSLQDNLDKEKAEIMELEGFLHTAQHIPGVSLKKNKIPNMELSHTMQLELDVPSEKKKTSKMESVDTIPSPQHMPESASLKNNKTARMEQTEPLYSIQLELDVSSEKKKTSKMESIDTIPSPQHMPESVSLKNNKTARMEQMEPLYSIQLEGDVSVEKEETAYRGQTKKASDPSGNVPEPGQSSEQGKTSKQIPLKEMVNVESFSDQSGHGESPGAGNHTSDTWSGLPSPHPIPHQHNITSSKFQEDESSEKKKSAGIKRTKPPSELQCRRNVSLEKFKRVKMMRNERTEFPNTTQRSSVFGNKDTFLKSLSATPEKEKTAKIELTASPHKQLHTPCASLENNKIARMELPHTTKVECDVYLEKEGTAYKGQTKKAGDPLCKMPEPNQSSDQGKTSNQIITSEKREIINVESSSSSQSVLGGFSGSDPVESPDSLHSDITSRHQDDIYDLGYPFLEPTQFGIYDPDYTQITNPDYSQITDFDYAQLTYPDYIPDTNPDYIQITDNSGSIWGLESAVALPDDPNHIPDTWPGLPSPSPIPCQQITSQKRRGYEYTDHEPANERTNYSTMFRDPNDEQNYKRFRDNSG